MISQGIIQGSRTTKIEKYGRLFVSGDRRASAGDKFPSLRQSAILVLAHRK
jgi:hypothetical protein